MAPRQGATVAAIAASDASTPRVDGRLRALRNIAAVAAVAATIWAVVYGLVIATHAVADRGDAVARGWLEADERFTALAMGEATPGPLILVVTFIGFMAGWKAAPVAALQAGFEGAAVATLFAFLPSFAMIFGLAPFVRSIHPASWLGRAMTAVGAAVVAAIVLLAVKLATAALVSDGSIDPVAVVVALGSAAALLSGRASTPIVVAAAAAIGVLASLVG